MQQEKAAFNFRYAAISTAISTAGTPARLARFLANATTPTREKVMKSVLILIALATAVGACSFHSETVQRPVPATATVVAAPPPPPPVVYVPE